MEKLYIDYIEDCLEYLSGQRGNIDIHLITEDGSVVRSMAKQVSKGLALTDKQFDLAKKILSKYVNDFENAGAIDFQKALERNRLPLRQIDRSRYVKIVNSDDADYPHSASELLIKVRFPFNKKTIAQLYNIVKEVDDRTYHHSKGTHMHFFNLNEVNVNKVMSVFADKDFEIDRDLFAMYDDICKVYNNPQSHVPGIYNENLVNVNDTLAQKIHTDTNSDLTKIIDRQRRYAIQNINFTQDQDTLAKKIAHRNSIHFSNTEETRYTTKDLLEALYELDRFPLLVVIEQGREEENMYDIYGVLKNLIPVEQQSVLFRLDGDAPLNRFIQEQGLNNWVDENTKVVYVKQDKFTKVLLKADWKPIASYSEQCYTITRHTPICTYARENCDLIVFKEHSLYFKHAGREDF